MTSYVLRRHHSVSGILVAILVGGPARLLLLAHAPAWPQRPAPARRAGPWLAQAVMLPARDRQRGASASGVAARASRRAAVCAGGWFQPRVGPRRLDTL